MLYELLTSDDVTNIKLALQLKQQFSKEEWFDALEQIIYNCVNRDLFNYFLRYDINTGKLFLKYGRSYYCEEICELHKNTLKIKYKGDSQLKKIFKRFETFFSDEE